MRKNGGNHGTFDDTHHYTGDIYSSAQDGSRRKEPAKKKETETVWDKNDENKTTY